MKVRSDITGTLRGLEKQALPTWWICGTAVCIVSYGVGEFEFDLLSKEHPLPSDVVPYLAAYDAWGTWLRTSWVEGCYVKDMLAYDQRELREYFLRAIKECPR